MQGGHIPLPIDVFNNDCYAYGNSPVHIVMQLTQLYHVVL